MIIACAVYVALFATIMVFASTTIDSDTRTRATLLSGINLLAIAYLMVFAR